MKLETARDVKAIKAPAACLELANVQTIGDSLTKKVLESKSACKLVEEALRTQIERQVELEK